MSTQEKRLRILLSAYACEPDIGSEPGVGWNWARALIRRGHEVWVLTRANNRKPIERAVERLSEDERTRLHFIYYDLPAWAAWWKKGGRGVQLYYALWQRNILPVVKAAHVVHEFDLVHHLTFGVWCQPTRLYKLGIPVIFGPVGEGSRHRPILFKHSHLRLDRGNWSETPRTELQRSTWLANLLEGNTLGHCKDNRDCRLA